MTAENSTTSAVETQAEAAKDGSAPLACQFMKCPKDRPYCQMGSCVDKKTAEEGGGASGGFDYSKFMGGKKDDKAGAGGFDYSKFMKKDDKKDDKAGAGGFDYSKFMGGKKDDK